MSSDGIEGDIPNITGKTANSSVHVPINGEEIRNFAMPSLK